MTACMPSVVRTKKTPTSSNQKTFNRLRKKIALLLKTKEKTQQDLDTCLRFYYEKILPEHKAAVHCFIERVQISYPFYQKPRGFSEAELEMFKKLLLNDLDQIFALAEPAEIPSTIKEIYTQLSGIDYEEASSEKLSCIKDEMEEMFRESGVNIDLSGIDINDPQEEILRKMFQSIGEAVCNEEGSFQKAKTNPRKKQSQVISEELQKKSLNSIYKQLVKAFHPDLEQNAQQKTHKEELMKRVTCAYEKEDLYALLEIEMEWMTPTVSQDPSQRHQQLKTYNNLLKDQVEWLQAEIEFLSLHAEYLPLQRFYPKQFSGIAVLEKRYEKLKNARHELEIFVNHLRSSDTETTLKVAIRNHF